MQELRITARANQIRILFWYNIIIICTVMILCFWEVCVVLRRHKYGRKHTENVRFTRYSVPKYPKTFRFALISIISMKHIFQKNIFFTFSRQSTTGKFTKRRNHHRSTWTTHPHNIISVWPGVSLNRKRSEFLDPGFYNSGDLRKIYSGFLR